MAAIPVPERVRRWLAPPVAFVTASLGMMCIVCTPLAGRQLTAVATLDDRFVGWVGVGAIAGFAAAVTGLLSVVRTGAGPPIAVGAAAAMFGLALGDEVETSTQLALALVILGFASGALIVAGVCLTLELPPGWRYPTVVAWVMPLVAGWPLIGWRALHHDSPGEVNLAVHPSLWVVAVVSAALVLWAALAMLLDPPRSYDVTSQGWEIPWQVLAVVVAGVLIAVMLVGFAPDLQAVWLRPIVLVVSAAGVIGLALTTLLVPLLSARVGYVAILVVSVCAPTCVYLLLTTADVAGGEVSAPVVLVLTAAALAGSGVGWRRPMVSVELGLLVLAASAAGGWVMPSHGWWMAAAVAPFMLGSGACLVGGVRLSLTSPMTLRFAAAALVGAVLLGLLGAAPVSWALAGDAPVGAGGARAGGRAILGLTFAASVLGAAYVSVLASRLRSRSTPSGQKALEPSEQVG